MDNVQMIPRPQHLATLQGLLAEFPVVGLIGARQVGKSTLARQLAQSFEGESRYFDLEHPEDVARLSVPVQSLSPLRGLVVLDEIQRRPDLFPYLRVLADRPGIPARFLVLGSASPDLLRQSSESLAGRIAYHRLEGFDLSETGSESLDELWLRGGYPRSFLATGDEESMRWRRQIIGTYLERELGTLGYKLPPETMRRYLSMLAHHHAQVFRTSDLARSISISESTVRRYIDVLCSTFMARRLLPWHSNLAKREVKRPKVYFTDSGILHALLGLTSRHDLLGHPKLGDSFEGLAIHETQRYLGARDDECFFWGLHSGAELDLLVVRGNQRRAFEIKFTDSPRTTKSMHSAMQALDLDELVVLHPGLASFPIGDRIRAVALRSLAKEIEPLSGA